MGAASIGMSSVFEIGLTLPDVEESRYYGVPALKMNGQMLACTPLNKSAEADSVVVAIDFEQRAALLEKSPSLYYITDHYAPHPTMLIRLSKISRAELERTLRMAWDFTAAKGAGPPPSRRAKRRR
jgi:hypothetical protein